MALFLLPVCSVRGFIRDEIVSSKPRENERILQRTRGVGKSPKPAYNPVTVLSATALTRATKEEYHVRRQDHRD